MLLRVFQSPRIEAGDMSVWLCLPDEILLFIFSFLTLSDLAKCARTCQQFRRVAADSSLCKYSYVMKLDNVNVCVFLMLCSDISGSERIKEALYRIWCGVNRLNDCGMNGIGDTSDFVNTVGQLLLTRRGKNRMDGFDIVFEFYTAHL